MIRTDYDTLSTQSFKFEPNLIEYLLILNFKADVFLSIQIFFDIQIYLVWFDHVLSSYL